MTKTKANYGRVHYTGSVVFAMFIALLPTVVFYKIVGTKVGPLFSSLVSDGHLGDTRVVVDPGKSA